MKIVHESAAFPFESRRFVAWSFRRCCRAAGGLDLGLRYHFPTSIWTAGATGWSERSICIGLLFWQLRVQLWTRKTELG